jgi:hypothetical protein
VALGTPFPWFWSQSYRIFPFPARTRYCYGGHPLSNPIPIFIAKIDTVC